AEQTSAAQDAQPSETYSGLAARLRRRTPSAPTASTAAPPTTAPMISGRDEPPFDVEAGWLLEGWFVDGVGFEAEPDEPDEPCEPNGSIVGSGRSLLEPVLAATGGRPRLVRHKFSISASPTP